MLRHPTLLAAFVAASLTAVTALSAAPAAAGPNDYAFIHIGQDGAPGRFNPCKPLTYKFNPSQAPAGVVGEIHETLRRVSAVTALQFTYGGTTTVVPSRTTKDPSADLVFAWVKPGQTDLANQGPYGGPEPAGWGGATASDGFNRQRQPTLILSNGFVLMNPNKPLRPGFTPPPPGAAPSRGQVLMHEAAHALGLNHVDSTQEVMYETPPFLNPVAYGQGDAAGLRQVGGAHGCVYRSAGEAEQPEPVWPEPENRPTPTSSTSPSPEPQPTSSPSPEPSPSSPAPQPTEPRRNPTPSLGVHPTNVKFGGVVTVIVTGTPGATVDLYSRKYPNTTYAKIRDGLRLDSNGKVYVQTKPDVNMRFVAIDRTNPQPSSTAGSTGLVTVQKAISIDASGTGTTRTFSGTINPMHPGATVALYRNNALVKSGIPVNGARAYRLSVTVPVGSSGYQLRSGATGHNAASTSSVLLLTR